jgi:acetyltransferase-like isoleucine patch superfamily enzyme
MTKRFSNWKYPTIKEGQQTKYNWLVQNLDGFVLGINTDIGSFSYINALNGVVIEDNVQVGSHCSIYSVSTIDDTNGKVTLKNNCKIGSHSTVLPGVTIGKNSVVGAHSLINKDIPDNVLALGIPAKVIRKLDRD